MAYFSWYISRNQSSSLVAYKGITTCVTLYKSRDGVSASDKEDGSISVSGQLPTYPSPTQQQPINVGLGEG